MADLLPPMAVDFSPWSTANFTMMTLGVLSYVVGTAFFVLSVRGTLRSLGNPSVLTCAGARESAAPPGNGSVWVRGIATSGGRAAVVAPLSGAECLWFAARTSETDSRGTAPAKLRGKPRWERSGTSFALQDGEDASSRVTVLPEGLNVAVSPDSKYEDVREDQLVRSVTEFRRNNRLRQRGVGGWKREEWILPEGAEVYVRGALGEGVNGAVLSEPPSGGFLVTLRDPERQVKEAKAARLVWLVAALPGLLLLTYIGGLLIQVFGEG